MQFSYAAIVAAFVATVAASSNVTYVTEVVTSLTTYCPEATVLTLNSKTYTITEATTLTITDCPCTISKPVVKPTSAPVYVNSTVPVVTVPAPPPAKTTPVVVVGTVTPVTTKPAAFTGAANRAAAGSAAGLAGLLGLAAYIL